MGSGVLLTILVALWFVVLVPMVVSRGELATTPAEPVRILRRRSDRSAMSSAISKPEEPLRRAARSVGAENLPTEPIPKLPRRIPGATLDQDQPPVSDRSANRSGNRLVERPVDRAVDKVVAEQVVADSPARDTTARAETHIRARRRRMLTGMVGLAVLWALFAAFWQPVLWWPQVILDLVIFSYLVFLRLEAQREQDRQERRRARATVRVKMPEDRTERLVRRHTEYQAQVTAATEHQAIGIDDDDPSFAEMPTWQAAHDAHPEAEAPAWTQRRAV